MACAQDADCEPPANWCTARVTCLGGACVAWPQCVVTPWLGCDAAHEQCIYARGPDGPPLPPLAVTLAPATLTGIAAAVLVLLASGVALVAGYTARQQRRRQP